MLTTLSLLRHATGLLVKEPTKTLIVVGPALVMMTGVSLFTTVIAPDVLTGGSGDGRLNALPSNWLFLLAMVLGYSMMAIVWHRYTLSTTHAHLPVTLHLILNYLWRVFMLTLIQIAVYIVLITPLMMSSHTAIDGAATPGFISVVITTFVTELMLVWLSLRLSLILPAAALGHSMGMMHSWRYTAPVARQLWGIAAVLAFFNTLLVAATTYFDMTAPRHMLLFELPTFIIEGLLIFSILTTLYAVQVNKTPLANV